MSKLFKFDITSIVFLLMIIAIAFFLILIRFFHTDTTQIEVKPQINEFLSKEYPDTLNEEVIKEYYSFKPKLYEKETSTTTPTLPSQ